MSRTSAPYAEPEDVTGNRLPMQPTHKAALTVVYERALNAGGQLQLLSTLSYTSSRYPDIGNIDLYRLPGYGTLGPPRNLDVGEQCLVGDRVRAERDR